MFSSRFILNQITAHFRSLSLKMILDIETDDFKVIEYLNKKGYSKTEAMLRAESANQEVESSPVIRKTELPTPIKYTRAFGKSLLFRCESCFRITALLRLLTKF